MQSPRQSVLIASRIRERLASARAQTDALFAIVRPDALYERPIAERHRLVFYRGHLEAFDWNLLREPLVGISSFAPDIDRLFAFGIDPVGSALPSDEPDDWPRMDHVERYGTRLRDTIDRALERLASRVDAATDTADDHPLRLLNMAIEHRLMHAETLAYLLHRLPYDLKRGDGEPDIVASSSYVADMADIPAGSTTLGRERDEGFGWDNEYDAQVADVPAFAIDRRMVTNGDYMRFVDAGGYDDRAYWTAEDWHWKSAGIAHPAFWIRSRDGWRWRGMFAERPLPRDWPVYVSHAEASAYARWAGKALPTEAQWQRAATGMHAHAAAADSSRANFDFHRFDPLPVQADDDRSAFGVAGLRGNGWEWTSSVFAPLPGFRPSPHYRGYSADFFDGRHYVLKGGSSRTAACIARPSFRNWFQPHYPYVYAGFRCVSA